MLVRIRAAGLCHSDLSVISGDRPRPVPMVLGHESAGEVAACGLGVTDLRPGDRVILVFMPSCGCCLPCAEAALFGCAVLTGVGAVINTARLQAGTTAAVLGLGGVGFSALLAALASGARDVIAIDLNESKLALARELGATATFNVNDPEAGQKIKDLTRGGVDYAFEMAGAIPALELAWRVTRRGGCTVTAGLPHPDKRFSFSPVQLVGEERTLRGSYIGSAVPSRDIPRYVQMYQRGRLPVNRLMGEKLALEDINLGFDRMASGAALRDMVLI